MATPRRFLALALLIAACDSAPPAGDDALVLPEGCNPLAAEHDCLLPYPSDVFLVNDANQPGGKRVALTPAARPRTAMDQPYDFMATHPADGFSPAMPLMAYFKGGVSTTGVVFHSDDPQRSLQPDSRVVLLDTTSNTLVPVWAEVDRNTDEPTEQVFLIRPFQRLQEQRRYVVALQGLVDAAGQAVPAPRAFARLRDGTAPAALSALAGRYESDVFAPLAKVGVTRRSLQLAWDFTTSSAASASGDLLALRADLLPRLAAAPPRVTLTKVTENAVADNAEIWLRVEGTIAVPLYLESDRPGAGLNRDVSGKVQARGEAQVPFTLQLPQSARPSDAGFTPVRILEYGHGFFGLREEINYGYMRGYTLQSRSAAVAVDWWGMSEDDLPVVTQAAIAAPGSTFDFVDRLHQAMANMIALSYAVRGPLAEAPELRRFGKTLYDPQQLFYYGISQGSIFGVTLLALHPTLERGALSVGGGPYSLMMSRSASFGMLFGLLKSVLAGPVEVQKFLALSQSTWDRVDPVTYAPHLLRDSYPGSPANRQLLFQIGIGDHSVNNLASHYLARGLGLPVLQPAPVSIYGLQTAASPAQSAMEVVDFKLARLPGVYSQVATEADKNDVHEGVRRNSKIKEQLDLFFRKDGVITHTCAGPCDPE